MKPGEKSSIDGQNLPRLWKTPHGFANTDKNGKTAGAAGEMAKQAVNWQTPRAKEAGGYNQQKNGAHTLILTGQAINGKSTNAAKKKLNPKFVAWLMGFDPQYLEPTNFGPSAMQSFQSAARRHLSFLLNRQA